MIFLKKGTKLFCRKCNAHLATTTTDLKCGDQIQEAHFTGGQDFKFKERMQCKNCGTDFNFYDNHARYEQPSM